MNTEAAAGDRGFQMPTGQEAVFYPTLPRRIYAAAIDETIVILGIMIGFLLVGQFQPPAWLFVALVVVLVGIEPVLVTFTGASIGHHMFGLRVVDARSGERVGIVRSILRMIARILFGLPSLLLIHISSRYQAIHDLVARSVITVRNPSDFPQAQRRSARPQLDVGYVYPSRRRRIAITALYSIGLYLLLIVIWLSVVGESCMVDKKCTTVESVYELISEWVWFILTGVVWVYGWRGRLWGGRRRKMANPPPDLTRIG